MSVHVTSHLHDMVAEIDLDHVDQMHFVQDCIDDFVKFRAVFMILDYHH